MWGDNVVVVAIDRLQCELSRLRQEAVVAAAEYERRGIGPLTTSTASARHWAHYALLSSNDLSLTANLARVLLEQCDRTDALEPKPAVIGTFEKPRAIALGGLDGGSR